MRNRACASCGHINPLSASECMSCAKPFPREERGLRAEGTSVNIPDTCSISGCRFPPAYSPSTMGGGPFLCQWHRQESNLAAIDEIVRQSQSFTPDTVEMGLRLVHSSAMRFCDEMGYSRVSDRVRASKGCLKPSQRHPKQWARDIIERKVIGEPVTELQLRFARQALRMPRSER